jgi:hypothetical protein
MGDRIVDEVGEFHFLRLRRRTADLVTWQLPY